MQSVGTFFSTVTKIYNEINPATLSGAIDVVVVEQPDGELACSPFHVRFGKLNLLRPQDKIVEMTVNGRIVDLPMKVGKAGEAFFVFQTEQDVPEEFATSPLAGPASDRSEDEIDFLDLSQDKERRQKQMKKQRQQRNKRQQQQLSNKNDLSSQDLHDQALDTGYVSAHSGHGTDFEDEDDLRGSHSSDWEQDLHGRNHTPPSPLPSPLEGIPPAPGQRDNKTFSRPEPSPLRGVASARISSKSFSSARAQHRSSFSVPSSPRLNPIRQEPKHFGILERPFQAVNVLERSTQPTRGKCASPDTTITSTITPRGSDGYHPLTPISPDSAFEEGIKKRKNKLIQLPSAPADNVILDMTGYKTEDESDEQSDDEAVHPLSKTKDGEPRIRKPRHRKTRALQGIGEAATILQSSALRELALELESRLPQPATKSGVSPRLYWSGRGRSHSLPNLQDLVLPEKMDIVPMSSKDRQIPEEQVQNGSDNKVDSGISTSATLTPSLQGSPPSPPSHRASLHHRKPSVRVNNALNALSDTELEYQTPRATSAAASAEWTWGWGGLPVKNEGIKDLEAEDHVHSSSTSDHPASPSPKPELKEIEIGDQMYRLAISLCPGNDFGKDLASETLFAKNQISFEEFGQDPLKFLNDVNLVCLINDRYYTWSAAGPQLASLLLFHQPLPDATLHHLSVKDARSLHSSTGAGQPSSSSSSRSGAPTRFSALSRWLRGSQSSSTPTTATHVTNGSATDEADNHPMEKSSTKDTAMVMALQSPASPDSEIKSSDTQEDDDAQGVREDVPLTIVVDKHPAVKAHPRHERRYAKTLRLTSDQLKTLNLKRGANTLTFSVASSYQGKATCVAKLFLWQYDYQVVISDIDGTITKSDALGHIFTMAGKDWTHSGVAKLYTDIVNNGYHILYLTSRAIGQADYTRKYLKGVEQDNYQLPDGPVIMSPDRLFTAFHREVIMRKPEEFKMACLRDIKRLFEDRNPFYAGFGNRYTDMLSYRSVSVPVSRIFTIDSGGEVKLELLSTYKSTYIALNDLVHQMFPCQKVVSEYNDWNYWKQPLPTIALPLAPSPAPVPQAKVPIESGHGSAIPPSTTSRLGVIRSLTSSLTSASSRKKRPSIPAFASSNTTPSSSHSATFLSSSTATTTTTISTEHGSRPNSQSSNGYTNGNNFAPGSPPSSTPARMGLATRTRRLSLSLMRYGSHNSTTTTSSSTTLVESSSSGVFSSSTSPDTITTINTTAASEMYGSSSPGQFPSSPMDITRKGDGRDRDSPPMARSRGFSVSPPPFASRLSETVLPYLRGTSSSNSGVASPQQNRARSHSSASDGCEDPGSNMATDHALEEQPLLLQLQQDNMEPIVGSWPTSERLASVYRYSSSSWASQDAEAETETTFSTLGTIHGVPEYEEDEDDGLAMEDGGEEAYDEDELELEEDDELFPDEELHLNAPFL